MTITTKKENNKDKIQEAYKLIKQGINNITSSKQYKEFLAFSSRFYSYSLNNQLLIWAQKPTATYIAGFNTWKKLGRHVKKGEQGIKILAPMQIRTVNTNDDGEEEILEFKRYRIVSVFDISQTDGEAIPTLHDFVKKVPGETELYDMFRKISPFPVEELNDCGGADGYFNLKSKEIKIWSKNPTSHRLLTLIHEIAHGLLHSDRNSSPSKRIMEIEAESVGFVVCHTLGIDTTINSIGYLVSYGGFSTCELVEDSKERINEAARKILTAFEKENMPKQGIEVMS